MKNTKIGFIAIGQAGGNIGQEFERYGFPVVYLNTSPEDLATLSSAKHKYAITNGEGCNKDRDKAKNLVVEDFEHIASKLDSVFTDTKMLFTIFSSGGGTGSGAGPMLTDLLVDNGENVGCITVLPAKNESLKAQINSYECFTELLEIEGTGNIFILDNDGKDMLAVNHSFVDAFTDFVEIPETFQSVRGNVDHAEVMETLQAHGMAIVTGCRATDSATLIGNLKESIFAPMENDRVIKYITAGFAGSCNAADLITAFGEPIDTFQTFDDEGKDSVCCLAGLSFPTKRLQEIFERVKGQSENAKKSLAAVHGVKLQTGINFLNESRKEEPKKEKKSLSNRDIMMKYMKK